MADLDNLGTWYVWSFFVTSCVLIPVYGALLWKNHKGSQYDFINQIGWLSLASAVGILFQNVCKHQWENRFPDVPFLWLQMDVVFSVIAYAGFGLAHWLYCHKYYKISNVINYYRAQQAVPQAMVKRDKITNYVMITLNIVPALLEGVSRTLVLHQFYYNGYNPKLWQFDKIYTSSKIAIGAMTVVSAGYLGVGVTKLYKNAKNGQGDEKINVPHMLAHAGAFGTYMASLMVLWGLYLPLVYNRTAKTMNNYVMGVIVSNYLNLISQIMMVLVLWPLTDKKPPAIIKQNLAVQEEEEEERAGSTLSAMTVAVQAEEWDEEAEFAMHTWSKLIRCDAMTESGLKDLCEFGESCAASLMDDDSNLNAINQSAHFGQDDDVNEV